MTKPRKSVMIVSKLLIQGMEAMTSPADPAALLHAEVGYQPMRLGITRKFGCCGFTLSIERMSAAATYDLNTAKEVRERIDMMVELHPYSCPAQQPETPTDVPE